MINRRTFLKLSAGALVLTAAGALTGCGDTVVDKTSGVAKIGDVTFICATPFLGGGDNFALTYCTEFTVQNNSAERVVIKPEDITCIFRESDTEETLYFKRNELIAAPGQTVVYNGSQKFYLETKERIPEKNSPGTYELRVRYNGKTAVFLYGNNGKNVTGRVEKNPIHPAAGHFWKQECPAAFVLCRITCSLHWGWQYAQSFTHFLHVHGRGKGGKAVE